jgi:hypothetical protein
VGFLDHLPDLIEIVKLSRTVYVIFQLSIHRVGARSHPHKIVKASFFKLEKHIIHSLVGVRDHEDLLLFIG